MANLLSNEYIRYLNDAEAYGLTYDQWKYLKRNIISDLCSLCGNSKEHSDICPKCKY